MTAPDATIDQQLSEEDLAKLQAAIAKCAEEQPTLHLLDVENAEWYSVDGDLHEMSFGDVDGYFDVAAARFLPDDSEQVRLLLVETLQTTHGETPFDLGGRQAAIDWTTVQITSEDGGLLQASASTADGDPVSLTVDLNWQVTAAAAAGEEAAEINGEYLGGYYGDTAFPFEGQDFVLDWTTWESDQTTDEGLVGASVNATGDGASYRLYAWFDPDVGIQVVQAEPLDEAGGADADEDEGHGITAEYLKDYYGDDPLEFDGQNFVVDWSKWAPDQETDDGRVGSPVPGVGSDGADYDLYVWFDLENGAQIVEATPLEAAAEDDSEEAEDFDARAHFDEVLVQELRDKWAANDNKLADGSKDYDVSAWINGEFDGQLEFSSHDGDYFYATLTASTMADEPKRVRCSLRIADADDVIVESEEVLS